MIGKKYLNFHNGRRIFRTSYHPWDHTWELLTFNLLTF